MIVKGECFPSLAKKVLIYYDVLYCDPLNIDDNDIIYCDTHHILKFKDILNNKKNLTIITHNSDYYVCDGLPFDDFGVNVNGFTCFTSWYSQNSYSMNANVIAIPIGFENTRWESSFGPKTNLMKEVNNFTVEPTSLIYFNCNLNTNTHVRSDCLDFAVKSRLVSIDTPNLNYKDYLNRIKQHRFTLSPRGNGLDCHRTWEVLMMKRVPVLKFDGALQYLYKNLPVLFVNDWSDLINMNLLELYDSFSFDDQSYLFFNYWENLVFAK